MQQQTPQLNIVEQPYKLSFQQSAKGFYYVDWSIRASTLDELELKTDAMISYVNKKLFELNGGVKRILGKDEVINL